MIARWHIKTCPGWLIRTLPALLAAVALAGCQAEGYPDHLTYPARKDPLVDRTKPVEKEAPGYDKPGEFPDEIFFGLDEDEQASHVVDPDKLSADKRVQLDSLLDKFFGTPAHPKVEGVETSFTSKLKLDPDTLERGSKMYRHQCLHCHGLTGDGRGPTSGWVNPHPRDYRQGIFKFTSSKQGEGERKPLREDLLRTLREGIPGTSMPSFRLLADDDLEALISYVIHLSLRGEVEYRVILANARPDPEEDPMDTQVQEKLTQYAGNWQKAQESQIQPGPYQIKNEEELAKSIERGYGLFSRPQPEGSNKSAGCLGCHLDYGRQSAYKYDYWGTVVRPADLTTGVLRGGRRPIDLYNRIHSGVNGVTMPASANSLEPQEIWDIVNFLQVLPYPAMREYYRKTYKINLNLEATN